MIRNFEEYTYDLTLYEAEVVAPAIEEMLLTCVGKKRAITSVSLVHILKKNGIKTSEPRIRHIIHVLRTSGAIERLIATSKGYYISEDYAECITYLQSLNDRLRTIYEVYRSLSQQVSTLEMPISELIEIREMKEEANQLNLF